MRFQVVHPATVQHGLVHVVRDDDDARGSACSGTRAGERVTRYDLAQRGFRMPGRGWRHARYRWAAHTDDPATARANEPPDGRRRRRRRQDGSKLARVRSAQAQMIERGVQVVRR
jgi:hypothetical protein